MTTNKTFALAAIALAAALPLTRAAEKAPAPPSRADVEFVSPEKFTDLKDSQFASDSTTTHYVKQLREHIERRVKTRLPEDQKLVVTVTDIDMAGDFEPWRGPNLNDVRIVRDIYPPRIELSFKLLAADGSVLKEGTRSLRDLSFQMTSSPIMRDDPLRYEKTLLEDWLRSEFKTPKASSS